MRCWNVKVDAKNEKPKSEKEPNLPVRQGIKREIIAWFWVALAFMLINGTIGQARVIPSGSMENTLLIGDHLIMSRIGYDAGVPFTNWHVPLWRNPHRQEVIIFKPPYAPDTTDLIKRTIGLPGDTIDLRNGTVYINGREFNEPYTVGRTEPAPSGSAPRGYTDIKFPFHVPDNCYFAMGDNRTNSYDSRFWGCVPRNDIIGTPVMIYMSLDGPSDAWQPGQIRERFLTYARAILHPGAVRWKRLFHTF
jgi:signal peptidase I